MAWLWFVILMALCGMALLDVPGSFWSAGCGVIATLWIINGYEFLKKRNVQ